MARKMNSQEARLFADAVAAEGQSVVATAEVVLRALAERRDTPLELSPESAMWFGDLFPGTSGSRG